VLLCAVCVWLYLVALLRLECVKLL